MTSPSAAPKPAADVAKPKQVWRKRTASFSRWLHLYLSMLTFFVVLFFSITGLTLNHAEWFDGQEVERSFNGSLPAAWVNAPDTARVNKLAVVEALRTRHHIKGAVSDFLSEDDQCSVSFKGPGYSADAFINRHNGTYKLTETRLGLVAVLNDLHKGRDSGPNWSWLIDLSAGFLALVSLSGLVMLFFLKNKRIKGILVAILGGLVCWLLYWFLVP